MGRLLRDYPFATILALAGFFVGIALLFTSGFFIYYSVSGVTGSDISVFMNYVKDSVLRETKTVLMAFGFGLLWGIEFGIIGAIIDIWKRQSESTAVYGGKIQQIAEGNY